jgi:hypothetical protein
METQLRRKQISNSARIMRPKLALIYELSAISENPSKNPRDKYTYYNRHPGTDQGMLSGSLPQYRGGWSLKPHSKLKTGS